MLYEQETLRDWMWEAERSFPSIPIYTTDKEKFLIYKGIRLSYDNEVEAYIILDTRISDLYTPLTLNCLNTLKKYGFVRGADNLAYERNKRRVVTYRKKIEDMYNRIKKEVDKTKIRTYRENVHKFLDLMFFYKSKVQQHKIKYNLNKITL